MSLRRDLFAAWLEELSQRFQCSANPRFVEPKAPKTKGKNQICIFPGTETTEDEATSRRKSLIPFTVILRTWVSSNESPLVPFILICEQIETAIYEKWDDLRALTPNRSDDNCFLGLSRTEMGFVVVQTNDYDECILLFEFGIDYPRKKAHV